MARKTAGTLHHGRKLRRSVWSPLARFTGVVWLQVVGMFFSLIAVAMGSGAWKLRAGRLPGSPARDTTHLYIFLGVGAVFTYFALSSFWRARQRGRR